MLGKNWSDIALDTYEFYLEELNSINKKNKHLFFLESSFMEKMENEIRI